MRKDEDELGKRIKETGNHQGNVVSKCTWDDERAKRNYAAQKGIDAYSKNGARHWAGNDLR